MVAWQPSFIVMLINMLTVLIVASYLFCKIIRSHQRSNRDEQPIYYSAISFMAVCLMLGVAVTFGHIYNAAVQWHLGRGLKTEEFAVLNSIVSLLLVTENYLLLIALYNRLSGLLKEGPLALGRCTRTMYICILSTILILLLATPVSRVLGAGISVQRVLVVLVILSVEFVLCSLLCLFAIKLKQIQKNKTLIAYRRRQIVLAVLTVFNNMFFIVVTSYQTHANVSRWVDFISSFVLPLHVLLNFLTIALSYRCCDSMIVLFCGCLRCCTVIPITSKDHDAIFLEQMIEAQQQQQQEKQERNPEETDKAPVEIAVEDIQNNGNAPNLHVAVPGMNTNQVPRIPNRRFIYDI